MKIYVATSWRNEIQDIVVTTLKGLRYEVYDFKNPQPGNTGFSWKKISPNPPPWDFATYTQILKHPISVEGFRLDMDALRSCDVCILVLPCGRSAHLELGWASGNGKFTMVYMPNQYGPYEPELMYKMCDSVVNTVHAMVSMLGIWRGDKA